ncbi:hypothetical protein D3C87_1209440 [compost metagenome]
MKASVALTLLLSTTAHAGLGNCPAHAVQNKDAMRMIHYLQEMQGRYQLGSCYIELQVCNPVAEEAESNTSVIADMVVVDKKGFERYIPFYVPEFKQNKSSQIHLQNARMLHYRFNDHNYDSSSGADERWMIEFVKTSDLQKLKYLEVGYSSETQREQEINKKWIICGTEREHEVNDHPIRHKFKSWWHQVKN